MIPISQVSFLIRLLEENETIKNRFNLEAEDVFDKLEAMSEEQRANIHRYMRVGRTHRTSRILETLGIELLNDEKEIMRQEALYDSIREQL